LDALLDRHRMRIVHPVPARRSVVRVDAAGELLSRRASPLRPTATAIFAGLVSFPTLLSHPHLTVEVLLCAEDHVRAPTPRRGRRRRFTAWLDAPLRFCAQLRTMTQERNSLMVLVAGPYRSGTNGEPAKMAANVDAMNRAALDVFRAGHLPVTGEALALPLIDLTGAFDEIFHPIARRLVDRCDAVLRIGGPSTGADEMVARAQDRGAHVVHSVAELP